eukprot:SAG31_NODE_2597_length_5420_cov_16.255403_5_plen_60_part_00
MANFGVAQDNSGTRIIAHPKNVHAPLNMQPQMVTIDLTSDLMVSCRAVTIVGGEQQNNF